MNEIETCPVCGNDGVCGRDEAGRPFVHTDWDDAELAVSA